MGSSQILTEGKTQGRHSGIVYKKGDLLQRFEYSPFGQERFVLNPNLQIDPSFTGQPYDVETGLYFYKARYYNPQLGRFIQPDTIVPDAKNLQAYNRYTYVNNNPLKYIDPTGHGFWSWFKKIFGAFIGAFISVLTFFALAPASFGIWIAIGLGAISGLAGGVVGGAISGGLKGALLGAAFGLIGGAITAGAGFGLAKAIGEWGSWAVLSGVGAGISYATGGWKGLITFGAGLAGGITGRFAGAAVKGQQQEAGTGGPDVEAGGDRPLIDEIQKIMDSTLSDPLPDYGGAGLQPSESGLSSFQQGQSIGSTLKMDVDLAANLVVRSVMFGAGGITAGSGGFLIQFGMSEMAGLGHIFATSGFLVGMSAIGDGFLIVGVGTFAVGAGALLITEGLGVTNFSGLNSNEAW